jgi:hypothetical protein
MMMTLRDFGSGYKTFHCVVCGCPLNDIVFGSLVARERVPMLQKYLVLATIVVIRGSFLRSIMFSLSNSLS